MAWNHDVAGSGRGVGRFFCFCLSRARDGDELRGVGAFSICMLKLKRWRQIKS